MQLTTLLTTFAAAAALVVAAPSPLLTYPDDWAQTFYASSDCSGTPIQVVVDSPKNGCTHLPTTAYSATSIGDGCCGAYLYSSSDGNCLAGGATDAMYGNVSCTSYPAGVVQVTPVCC
ncbi:hypothetical protein L226DRAFT_464112 [Lentinus tigrinus ALCF2SS1-7]|uniref:uncharacterized protein n=1 Tax=Lentinus tigrinus ALCF2SS1-7 TaxID=1328758 RepID=UPI001165D3AD|nr:hypothetical protein L226DRAFT_464112 [Lentinus tigrinus ALCF2SS1-7]